LLSIRKRIESSVTWLFWPQLPGGFTVCAVLLLAIAISRLSSAAVIDDTWTDGSSTWNTPANWNNGVPNNNATNQYNVRIDNNVNANVTVSLDINPTINTLTVDSGDSLSITNGLSLSLVGASLAANGTVALSSTGNITDLILQGAQTTLSGSGSLTLSTNVNNRIYGNVATNELVNAATISGSGQLGANVLKLTNQGLVDANQSAVALSVDPSASGVTNTGTMRASAGATLSLTGGTFNNTGGVITALDASTVQLTSGATITGGTLSTAGSGVIQNVNTNTIGGLANTGTLNVANGSVLNVSGDLSNSGTIAIKSTANITDLVFQSAQTTVSGAGSLTLSANVNNRIYGSVVTNELINTSTISGGGQLGLNSLKLTNQGLVDANQSAVALTVDPSALGVTNTGTMRASAGATLSLTGGTFTNTGGVISALDTSIVQLSGGAAITGGTLSTAGTGVIQNSGINTIGSLTNSGTLNVLNSSTLNVSGDLNNSGTIAIKSTVNLTDLVFQAAQTTVSGGGSITLSASGNNRIYGSAITNEMINSSTQTISGGGQLGLNSLKITNQGLVDANQSTAALTIDPSASGVTNTATMRASAGATLRLFDGTFTNTSGFIRALDTSTVELSTNSVIVGGTLTTAGSGLIKDTNNAKLQDLTLDTASQLQVINGDILSLQGTITNNGTVTINSTANLTDLIVQGASTTLAGNGTISLSANGNNRIYGSVATNELINSSTQTISGSGQLGANGLKLTNQGLVDANQSAVALTIDPSASGVTNTATMRASAGATLSLTGGTFTNTGGTISALDTSIVQLSGGAAITGGLLSTSGSGVIQNVNSNTIGSLTNSGTLNSLNGSTLNVSGDLNNSGTITLKSTANFTDLVFQSAQTTVSGGGSITLSANVNNRIYGSAATNELINSSTQTISGSGQLGANSLKFTNQGLVDANQSTAALTVDPSGSGVTNTGTMRASAGATLSLTGGTFTNTGGVISALDTSTVQLAGGAAITGGILSSVGTGVIQNTSANTIGSLTNSGTLNSLNGSTLNVSGNLNNSGTIAINSVANFTDLVFQSAQTTVSGSGAITMSASGNARIYGSSAANELINASTISGGGQLGANSLKLTNQGLVDANSNGVTMNVTATTTNFGLMRASGGGTLQFASGVLTNLSGSTLTGGSFEADANSTITLPGSITTNAATVTLSGTNSKFDTINPLATNQGVFEINSGRNFTTAGALANSGLVRVGSTSTLTVSGAISQSATGVLRGNGTVVAPSFQNDGFVSPGTSPGLLTYQGSYMQTATGNLDIEIAGTTPGTEYSVFAVTGAASLAGKLIVDGASVGGVSYTPTIGQMYDVLTATGGVSGTFSSTISHWVISGSLVHYSTTYGANKVTLQVTSLSALTPGDYNGDGFVDAADYSIWRDTLGSHNPAADGNVNGMIDPGDFDIWKLHFGAHPGSGANSNSAVPEPSSMLLLVVGLLLFIPARFSRTLRLSLRQFSFLD
jgi:hypothetical protein